LPIFKKEYILCGIYIHIPFCRKACFYCNFHFSTSLKKKQAYINALVEEIQEQKHFFSVNKEHNVTETIRSLYFGGGTPSQLNISEIKQLLDGLYKNFKFASEIEFTIEVNPDDVSYSVLKAYKEMGVNRLSIGVQSFNNADLIYLNRSHTSEAAEESVRMAQDAGISNINIDLIYGIPVQTMKNWHDNLLKFLTLQIPHLSAYCLTIEPHTPLEVLIHKNKRQAFDEDLSIGHYKMLSKFMKANNYIQYEISNFCKPHHYSKHNKAYWQQKPYLGIGASAHSFNGKIRKWNISNTTQYIEKIAHNDVYYETEILTKETKYNEYMMTSLRTIEGCNMNYILKHFGQDFVNHAYVIIEKYKKKKLIVQDKEIVSLTDKGKLFADAISADLFWVR